MLDEGLNFGVSNPEEPEHEQSIPSLRHDDHVAVAGALAGLLCFVITGAEQA